MTRRARIWLAVAWLFALLNVGGAVFAAASHEGLHAGMHLALALVGAYVAWRLAARQSGAPAPATLSQEIGDRLAHLEQAIDTVAVEVERIGEGQRYLARLFAEPAAAVAAAASGPTPAAVVDAPAPARPA